MRLTDDLCFVALLGAGIPRFGRRSRGSGTDGDGPKPRRPAREGAPHVVGAARTCARASGGLASSCCPARPSSCCPAPYVRAPAREAARMPFSRQIARTQVSARRVSRVPLPHPHRSVRVRREGQEKTRTARAAAGHARGTRGAVAPRKFFVDKALLP